MPDRMVTALKPEASKFRMKSVGSDQKNGTWEKMKTITMCFDFLERRQIIDLV